MSAFVMMVGRLRAVDYPNADKPEITPCCLPGRPASRGKAQTATLLARVYRAGLRGGHNDVAPNRSWRFSEQ